MLQLSNAGKRFGPKLLFEGLDWLITPKDRVGLAGAIATNAAGSLLGYTGGPQADETSITASEVTCGEDRLARRRRQQHHQARAWAYYPRLS